MTDRSVGDGNGVDRAGDAPTGVDEATIGRIFREESGRSVATLIRVFGQIEIAEDAVQPIWHVLPGAASGTCFAGRVPLGQAPFLRRLRDRSLVRRLRR